VILVRKSLVPLLILMLLLTNVILPDVTAQGFDNGGGGLWSKYVSFLVKVTPSEYAQYRIEIDGSTWRLYNALGGLETTGEIADFWGSVKSDGSDIRIFDQDRNQLYFFIEEWNYTTQHAVIWVRVEAGIKQLNIAYGNPNATLSNYNDPLKVFEFFDNADEIKLSPTGAWCWFQDPRAIHANNKTFFGAVEKNGDIVIYSYGHTTKELNKYVLHPALEVDDHDVPAIGFLPNGSLIVTYSAHGGTTLYYRISTNPYNISSWGPEYTYSVPDGITYPSPIYLPAENRLYIFFRTGSYAEKWAFIYSDDMGNTWSNINVFFEKPTTSRLNQYFKIISNGYDKIYFAHTGHPALEHTGLYFMYYHNGSFYMMNGTKIADTTSLPIHREQMELVYDWTETGKYAWVWDIAFDENEYPVITFATFINETQHYYNYARWNGSAWEVYEVTFAGRTIDGSSEPYYSGGITINKENPNVIYFSKQDPTTGQFEIYKGITSDGGKTWTFEQLTANSAYKNVRPIAVVNGTDIQVIWIYGIYNHYTDFDTMIRNDWDLYFNATWSEMNGTFDTVFDSARNSNVFYLSATGSWGAADRSVLLSSVDFGNAVFDFYARMDVTTADGQVGLAFCVQDTNNYYYAFLDENVDQMRLGKFSGGTFTDFGTYSFSNDGSWHRYTVVKVGTSLKLLIDGQELISATDSEFTSGKFGLRSYRARNQMWDNIKVLKATDPADFESPELKSLYIVKKTVQLIDVLYVEYVDVNGSLTTLAPPVNLTIANKEQFDLQATADILNASQTTITIKIHSKINLASVSMGGTALTPTYTGNETIGGAIFSVYNVTIPGNGTLYISGMLLNVLWGTQVPDAVLLGDVLNISLPRQANATVRIPITKEYTWTGILWGGENISLVNGSLVFVNRTPYAYEDFSNVSDWSIDDTLGGTPTQNSSIGIPAPSYQFPDTSPDYGIMASRLMLPTHGQYVLEVWVRMDPTSSSGGAVVYLSTAGSPNDLRLAVYSQVTGDIQYATYPGGTETWTTFATGIIQSGTWYKITFVVSQPDNIANIYVYDEQDNLVASATNLDISGTGTRSTPPTGDVALYTSSAFTGDVFFDEIGVYERKVTINATPGFEANLYDESGSLIASVRDSDEDGVEVIGISQFLEPINATLKVVSEVSAEEVSFNNTDVVEYTPRTYATYVFEALVEDYANLEFGYIYAEINVVYGSIRVLAKDITGLVASYEPVVIVIENATTGEVIAEVVAHDYLFDTLPAGMYRIRILFKNIILSEYVLNLTTALSGSTIGIQSNMLKLPKDYRGIERSIIAPKDIGILDYVDESRKYPFSKIRVLLNGTGDFTLYINYKEDLPTKIDIVSNITDLEYCWDGSYLVVEGTLGSVGELIVTDLYKLRLEIYDRLGNLMPSWAYAYINETKYTGAIVENFYYPEDYVVKLPSTVNGFEFYGFFDGFNGSTRIVALNHTDVVLKAWYRVPTSFTEIKGAQVSSLGWIPFIRQEDEVVKAYIEGCLKDYYGNGVPNRPLVINITNVETSYTRSYNVSTDVTGYFRSPVIELHRGKTYRVEIIYEGDDIYVGTVGTSEVKPEELPVAPLPLGIPLEYVIIAIIVAIAVISAFFIARRLRHVIEYYSGKRRRFVRKKP